MPTIFFFEFLVMGGASSGDPALRCTAASVRVRWVGQSFVRHLW